jgi:mono/diheme cytochrome c family protein
LQTLSRALGFVVVAWATIGAARAETADNDRLTSDVLPLLKARCVKCHGPGVRKGGLSLATAKSLARGGKHGKAVLPGKPNASSLWERVEADEMPPDELLTDAEKMRLLNWIAAGAAGLPTVVDATPEGADHWAFAAPARPVGPLVQDPSHRARNEVDRFVQDRLERAGTTLAPEAERATLIRRLSFDLTGLPPAPAEISAFEAERAPDAYERLVERMLAAPAYGERWGKFWLDAAGYADSNGYFSADTDRPLAWRYRDWVIKATNADMPFDRFIREQLAGDELAGPRPPRGAPVSEETAELLVASHFLRNGQDGTGESDGNPDEVRADRFAVIEGAVQTIGSALLGMTVQCARCHDHKFEPITQRDYYALQAILRPAFPVDQPDRWKNPNARATEAPTVAELSHWADRTARLDAAIVAAMAGGPAVDKPAASLSKLVSDHPGRIAWLCDVVLDPPVARVLNRGDYGASGPIVEPAGPAVLSDATNPWKVRPPPRVSSTGRRLALAEWLTRPGSRPAALLARVTVNRVWQQHFGSGIVATPENLGYTGAPPSHPELLDWLAVEFIESGWSLKSLHRRIVLSSTYRQSSTPAAAARVDADGRLLSRFPMRRLDAEAIRDAMLVAAGTLDRTLFGPYLPSGRQADGEVVVEDVPGASRRSLYLQQRRTQVVSLLEVFDAPSIVTTCPKRATSTVPLQALGLLNSGFVAARARELAARLERDCGPDASARLDRAFRLATGLPPGDPERAAALRFLDEQPTRYSAVSKADAQARAWADLCQMILASNAFLYVE